MPSWVLVSLGSQLLFLWGSGDGATPGQRWSVPAGPGAASQRGLGAAPEALQVQEGGEAKLCRQGGGCSQQGRGWKAGSSPGINISLQLGRLHTPHPVPPYAEP